MKIADASVEGLGPWIVLCDPQEGGLLSDHSVYQRLPGPASVMVGVQVQVVQLQWTGRIRAGGRAREREPDQDAVPFGDGDR